MRQLRARAATRTAWSGHGHGRRRRIGGATALRLKGGHMLETVRVIVNGRAYEREVEPRLLLVHFLRDDLGLTGTHVGCDTSNCGACTVLVDGESVKACTLLAAQADGHE